MDFNIVDSWVEWYNKRLRKQDPKKILNDIRSKLSKAFSQSETFETVDDKLADELGLNGPIVIVMGNCNHLIKSFVIYNEPATYGTEGEIFIPGVDYLLGFRVEFTVWDTSYNGSIFIGVDRDLDVMAFFRCTNWRTENTYHYTLTVFSKHKEEKEEKGRRGGII